MKWNLILRLVVLSVIAITSYSCDTTISDITDITADENSLQNLKSNYLGAKIDFEFFDQDVKISIYRNDKRVQTAFFADMENEDSDGYTIYRSKEFDNRYMRLKFKEFCGYIYDGKIEGYEDGVMIAVMTFN